MLTLDNPFLDFHVQSFAVPFTKAFGNHVSIQVIAIYETINLSFSGVRHRGNVRIDVGIARRQRRQHHRA